MRTRFWEREERRFNAAALTTQSPSREGWRGPRVSLGSVGMPTQSYPMSGRHARRDRGPTLHQGCPSCHLPARDARPGGSGGMSCERSMAGDCAPAIAETKFLGRLSNWLARLTVDQVPSGLRGSSPLRPTKTSHLGPWV